MATGGQLAGRLALVTGAGSGIGKAVCQAFAKAGASVAALDINEAAVKETVAGLQGKHEAYVADVTSDAEVRDVLTSAIGRFSQVPSIAINSAGIFKAKAFLKMSGETFDEVMDVNAKGTFLVTQAVARHMVERKVDNGSVINISSVAGKVGMFGNANYCASKSAVIGLTRVAAKELARHGIRCNSVLPGFIDTPILAGQEDRHMQHYLSMIPLGRFGSPQEIADVCLFLAGPQSSYMTGATLEVTGGLFM